MPLLVGAGAKRNQGVVAAGGPDAEDAAPIADIDEIDDVKMWSRQSTNSINKPRRRPLMNARRKALSQVANPTRTFLIFNGNF